LPEGWAPARVMSIFSLLVFENSGHSAAVRGNLLEEVSGECHED
jgi:hypothetical protein